MSVGLSAQRATIIASLLLLSAELCFASVSALVKALSPDVAFEQLVFFRNVMALVILLPWIFRYGLRQTLTSTRWRLHWVRGLVGLGAMYLFFYAISTIPLAQATLVLLMSPFLIPLMGYIWLQEPVSRQTWIAIIFGFIGVFVFLNPLANQLSPIVLLAFLAAAMAAMTKTVIRRLSRTEPTRKIVLYFSAISTLVSAIPLLWMWQPMNLLQWGAVLLMGTLAVTGQLAMTRAFATAPAAKVGVFTYSSVLFASLMGYIFFDEALAWHMLWGAIIIVGAGYLAVRTRHRSAS